MKRTDYKAALEATRNLMLNMQRQNEKLIQVVGFYAFTDWRDVTLNDRGKKAREVLCR